MEMNAANVAQHELFRVKQRFVDKKNGWKKADSTLSTEEIQEIMDNAVSVTTKKPQSSRLDYLTVPLKLQN